MESKQYRLIQDNSKKCTSTDTFVNFVTAITVFAACLVTTNAILSGVTPFSANLKNVKIKNYNKNKWHGIVNDDCDWMTPKNIIH